MSVMDRTVPFRTWPWLATPIPGSWSSRAQTVPDGPVRYSEYRSWHPTSARPGVRRRDHRHRTGGRWQPRVAQPQLSEFEGTRECRFARCHRRRDPGPLQNGYDGSARPVTSRRTVNWTERSFTRSGDDEVTGSGTPNIAGLNECSSRCLASVGASGGRRGQPRCARGGRSISVIARHVGRDRPGGACRPRTVAAGRGPRPGR